MSREVRRGNLRWIAFLGCRMAVQASSAAWPLTTAGEMIRTLNRTADTSCSRQATNIHAQISSERTNK